MQVSVTNLSNGLRLCFGTFTSIRVKRAVTVDARAVRYALALTPIVSLIVSGTAAVVGQILFVITDSRVLMAIAIVASEVYFTGSLHADGVADTADGFSAARKTDREHGLAAMKDPRIGAIGTLALLFTYGSQIAMVTFLANPWYWIPAGIIARASVSYLCSSGTSSARRDGIGLAFIGAINTRWLAVNTTISLLLLWGAFALLPLRFVPILVTVAILVLVGLILNLFKRRSIRRLGGLTGDVLGAGLEIARTLTLLVLVVSL